MSANAQPLIATIYNPQNQNKEALIAGFIARKQKFERIFRDIRDAPMIKPEQHYLIQGIRGMGKTTLLLRIAYEIDNTPELRQRLIPIVFNEEEYGIGTLADIWERTAQYLGETDVTFTDLYDTITKQYGQDDYEQVAFQTLIGSLQQQGKKLLLLIDNIGDVLKKLDDQEGKRLREILLTTPELRLIGATSVVIEQVHDYTKPFYEFFKIIHLNGLSREEATELFLNLGETYHTDAVRELIEQQSGRIEAIRRLTGGVIRTMVLLFEILVENDSGSVFRDLNVLLDRVTPLYKHRLDDLPAQQQKIVAALAQAWDAASAKELAKVVRLESKVVSAQLKQLINNGVVEKVETNTKNHLYRLEERFFNIWYLMRFGRRTDQRVLWLIKFFETMFDGDNKWMEERIAGHVKAMELGILEPEAALFLTLAFSEAAKNEDVEDMLKKKVRQYLYRKDKFKLLQEVPLSAREVITVLLKEKNYDKAIKNLILFSSKSIVTYLDMSACYLLLNKNTEAINALLLSLNQPELIKEVSSIIGNNDKIEETDYIAIRSTSMVLLVNSKGFKYNLSELAADIAIRFLYFKAYERKTVSLELINRFSNYPNNQQKEDPQLSIIRNIIYLINNKYGTILTDSGNPFDLSNFHKVLNQLYQKTDSTELGQLYLRLLLVKKQYHTAYNYFQQEEWQLKDRFKPLYYATLYFLKDEYPTEYLRMGPELKETVDDVLAEVAQMAIDYA